MAALTRQESRARKSQPPLLHRMRARVDPRTPNRTHRAGSNTEMSTTNRITHGDTPQLTNGKLATQVNGSGEKSAKSSKARGASPRQIRAQAAPVDAQGTSHAPAPAPPAAASTTHDACAAAACVSNEKRAEEHVARRNNGVAMGSSSEQQIEKVPVPPGAFPLPKDGASFVNAVHEKADILEVSRMLLNSTDEKIVKAVWDRLVNLKFGKVDDPSSQEPQRIVIDIPGAQREWPDDE